MRTIGVILSGCGVQDGTEIQEAVLTMLALDRAGVRTIVMAPDKAQADVVDHRTGKVTAESRNVLTESARIARGELRDVASVRPEELDAVILPGGFGAAKNLSTFAKQGAKCVVDEDVANLLRKVHAEEKPIAALCIAPVVLAGVFGKSLSPEVTIGKDAKTAKALETMGAKHFEAETTEIVVDEENRLVTTPCYMSAKRISEVAVGAEKAVQALVALIREPALSG